MFKKLCKLAYTHRKALAAVFAIYCAMLILVILFGAYFLPEEHKSDSIVVGINDGWRVLEDGKETSAYADLPYRVKDKKCKVVELYRTLPETEFPSGMLVTTAYQKELDVSLDNDVLYSYHPQVKRDKIFTPGSGRFFIQLPEGFAGREIHLRYERTVLSDGSSIDRISLQSHLQNPFSFMPGSELLFILMFALFTIGVVLLVIAVVSNGRGFFTAPLFPLALFAISCSAWVSCNTKLAQFFTQNLILLHNLEYISLYVMPLELWVFAWVTWRRSPKTTPSILVVMSGFFAISLTLKFFGVLEFYSLLTVFHLLLLCSLGAFIFSLRGSFPTGNVPLRIFFTGAAVLAVCSILEVIRYYLFDSSGFVFSFFVLGVVFLACCTLASYLYGLKQRIQVQAENRMYKQLAYTDKLTGLRNRLTFEEDLEKLEQAQDKYRSIIISNLDVNNFKRVNDTYGHMMGDEVLKAVAARLAAICNGKNRRCYRLGGDEFCLVATDDTVRGINNLLERMNGELESGFSQFPVAVAFGTAEYNKFLHSTLMDVFKTADDLMYRSKQGQPRRASDRIRQS